MLISWFDYKTVPFSRSDHPPNWIWWHFPQWAQSIWKCVCNQQLHEWNHCFSDDKQNLFICYDAPQNVELNLYRRGTNFDLHDVTKNLNNLSWLFRIYYQRKFISHISTLNFERTSNRRPYENKRPRRRPP